MIGEPTAFCGLGRAGFGELFFFMVSGARTWPEATMRQWLSSAGFEGVGKKRLWLAPAVIVSGYRPAGG